MRATDRKPTGTNVGYCRLQKRQGSTYVQIVDFTRYELSSQCIRFREENWIASMGDVAPSSQGRNTDDFAYAHLADEYFAWWLKSKMDDGYQIVATAGTPGPLPEAAPSQQPT